MCRVSSGTCPTYDISTEFEIQRNFAMLLFITCSADHNEILHTSQQWHCRDMCKISLWLDDPVLNQSTRNFYRISNSIEIQLAGRAPRACITITTWCCHNTSFLTHWGLVTHICVSKLTIIGSDNGLSPGRRQAIICTNAGILLIGPLGTNPSEILIGIQTFS